MAGFHQQIYSAARRGMIVARVHVLLQITEEMHDSLTDSEIDPADVASRLIASAVILRLLVTAEDTNLAEVDA